MSEFDPQDKNSWYFGTVSREEANSILQSEQDNGIFLVRDSTSIKGDFVVCVKEDNKISHYIVNRINSAGTVRFRIGDQEFPTLSALLKFYKSHCLDTTPLRRPAQRQKYRAKYKFPGRDPDDLPFEKNDILTIIRKDEEQWWLAANEKGLTGLVPVPYIEKYTEEMHVLTPGTPGSTLLSTTTTTTNNMFVDSQGPTLPDVISVKERKLPARAKVIKNRDPNAYDKRALKLKVDDEILVTCMNPSGQWEGRCRGQEGIFPFTHVKFIEEEEEEDATAEGGGGGGDDRRLSAEDGLAE